MHEGHKRFEVQGFGMGQEVERKFWWQKGKGAKGKVSNRQSLTEREPLSCVHFRPLGFRHLHSLPVKIVAVIMPYRSLDVKRVKVVIFSQNGGEIMRSANWQVRKTTDS